MIRSEGWSSYNWLVPILIPISVPILNVRYGRYYWKLLITSLEKLEESIADVSAAAAVDAVVDGTGITDCTENEWWANNHPSSRTPRSSTQGGYRYHRENKRRCKKLANNFETEQFERFHQT